MADRVDKSEIYAIMLIFPTIGEDFMKKCIFPLLLLVFAWGALTPLHASSKDETNATAKHKIVIKPGIRIELAKAKVEIIPGESEVQKQAKAEQAQRQLITRERVEPVYSAPQVNYDLSGLRALYQGAASKFGINWRLIEAVHQVESGKSTDTCKKSYAGATGPMQFQPSTFRHYANDGSDICSVHDAVYAAANLLASAGAAEGDIDSALYSYNHSISYVNLVKSVMYSI